MDLRYDNEYFNNLEFNKCGLCKCTVFNYGSKTFCFKCEHFIYDKIVKGIEVDQEVRRLIYPFLQSGGELNIHYLFGKIDIMLHDGWKDRVSNYGSYYRSRSHTLVSKSMNEEGRKLTVGQLKTGEILESVCSYMASIDHVLNKIINSGGGRGGRSCSEQPRVKFTREELDTTVYKDDTVNITYDTIKHLKKSYRIAYTTLSTMTSCHFHRPCVCVEGEKECEPCRNGRGKHNDPKVELELLQILPSKIKRAIRDCGYSKNEL